MICRRQHRNLSHIYAGWHMAEMSDFEEHDAEVIRNNIRKHTTYLSAPSRTDAQQTWFGKKQVKICDSK